MIIGGFITPGPFLEGPWWLVLTVAVVVVTGYWWIGRWDARWHERRAAQHEPADERATDTQETDEP